MRKSVLAATAGLILVAGQAATAGGTATVRVGDRVGAKSGTANEFADIPIAVLVMSGIVATGAVVISVEDRPASP